MRGTFAYVTSPLLLRLAKEDLQSKLLIPKILPKDRKALVVKNSALLENGYVLFEDLERTATAADEVEQWGKLFGGLLLPGEEEVLSERLAVVDDETMSFFWEMCTQVDARVRIDKGGVVQDGALWYEESLPAETVLVGISTASKPFRRKKDKSPMTETPADLLKYCLGKPRSDLQFGGKATVGRGRSRLIPVMGGGQ